MEHITLQQTRKKLSAYFAAIVFLMVLFLGILFLSVRYINEHRLDKARFLSQSQILLKDLKKESDNGGFQPLKKEFFNDEFIGRRGRQPVKMQLSYLVLDSQDSIIQKKILHDIDFTVLSGKFNPGFKEIDGVLFRKSYITSPTSGEKVIAFMEYRLSFQEYLQDVLWYFILASLFGIGFYYVGLLFVGKILKPVAENIEDMQNFIHNAGHELKTPIAVIDSNLQLLSKSSKPDPEMITESRIEIKRLNNLVEGLVDLADISRTSDTEIIDVEPEIKRIFSEYSTQIKAKKITTLIDFRKKLRVKANPAYLQIFLSNIIENAIKYNSISGSLHVTYDGDFMSISDTGAGMNSQEQAKIFDRFYQTTQARSGEGFGIGLSLVQKIASIYNWKISIDSRLKKGTRFDINF